MVEFMDIPFEGEAVATHNGKVIWSNTFSGDCPPDICMMLVKNMYIADGLLIFELQHEGE